jgi:4-hydroxy-3-polyprenylbenzoate decarboxylase
MVGISGASGAICGLRLLERLQNQKDVDANRILTKSGQKTLYLETGEPASDIRESPDFSYPIGNISGRLSSNLLIRAADLTLKEKRKLILTARETLLHGHFKTMTAQSGMRGIIAPLIRDFYNHPQIVMDIVDHSVDRVLDLTGLPDPQVRRWDGEAQ